jgi:hypothetical protein
MGFFKPLYLLFFILCVKYTNKCTTLTVYYYVLHYIYTSKHVGAVERTTHNRSSSSAAFFKLFSSGDHFY